MFFHTKRSAVLFLFIIPVVLFVIALGIYGWKTAVLVKTDGAQYQAVFLTNGQVYFGRARNRNAQYLTLTDVYYLQSVQPLQEPQALGDTKKKDAPTPPPAQPELTLVKLGKELHGPRDRMDINRDQVLFIEDLRDDGKVADAIRRYTTK